MKNKYLCLFPVLISCTLFTGCGITIGKVTIGTKDTIEYDSYLKVIQGSMDESLFMEMLEAYIEKECIGNERYNFPREDMATMLNKLHRALFQLYIV